MHDDRDAGKTNIRFDVPGEHVAVHFGHFRIDEYQFELLVQGGLQAALSRHRLQLVPCLLAVAGLEVFHAELVENLHDFLACNDGIIDKEYGGFAFILHRRDIGYVDFAESLHQDLLDVEDRNEPAVVKFGYRRDQPFVAGKHGFWRFHPVPVHPDDAVDAVHEESLGLATVFGHHHGFPHAFLLIDIEETHQIEYRDDIA